MKRIISILFALLCVCGCLRSAAAAAEEPPAVGQVQDVTTTLEDETTVSLQWSAVPEATGYKVAYYNEKTDKYKTLVTTTATRALLFSLERGKTYRLRVRAFRKDGGNVVWGAHHRFRTPTATPPAADIEKALGCWIRPHCRRRILQRTARPTPCSPAIKPSCCP
ncbi:MAG: fibronectin type III domain-containing protein, partial [Clostridia bacterium]|nr:fibronectin type III domain-containing protein [Clostridia bacterium]